MRTKLPANTPPHRDLRREVPQVAPNCATRARKGDHVFDAGWPVRVISRRLQAPVQPSGEPGKS